jgi:low affinity Fe/Cu permease
VNKKSSWFSDFARKTARAAGQPVVFALAGAVIVVWLISGPFFGFSDTWQLIINTGTTIVTFLMVFLIQNTQNRDSEAMHIKLDELIRAIDGAHNALLNLENLGERELDRWTEFEPIISGWHRKREKSYRRIALGVRVPPFRRCLNRICRGALPSPSLVPSPLGDRRG